jgi:membrane protein required for colicin V production
MGILDLFLVLLIGALAFMGLRSGLIHESVTLLGLVVALVVAGRFNETFGPLFVPWFHTRAMSNLAAFLTILVFTWGLTLVGGALLRAFLEGVHLGWLDNLGGMVFGIAKGVFLAEVIVLVLMAMPSEGVRGAVTNSFLGGWLAGLAPDLLRLVPPVLRYWQGI